MALTICWLDDLAKAKDRRPTDEKAHSPGLFQPPVNRLPTDGCGYVP